MSIEEIKKQMLNFRDFYGGDIPDTEKIKNAKTKKELAAIIEQHKILMEDMLSDSISHLDNFKKRIGLMMI